MVQGVTAQMGVFLTGQFRGPTEVSTPIFPFDLAAEISVGPGTDAISKADTFFLDARTLASGGAEDLDLTGALLDAFGATLTNAEIIGLYIEALAANTTNLSFFGGAATPFNGPLAGTTPSIVLGPGEFILLSSKRGWACGAGASDKLHVANAAGAAASYTIAAVGRTIAA